MASGGAASIWRRFCKVGGVTTELLGVNALSGQPRLQVVLIPGNPGSAAYFRPFMLSVHQQLGGHADVLAVTHAGHDPETEHDGRLWDLTQQVSHKVAFLRDHVLLPGRPPVLLVGHSIGAAIMVKAVAELENLSSCHQQQLQQGGEQQATNPLAMSPAAALPTAEAGGLLPPILKLVAVFPFFETNFSSNTRQRLLRALSSRYELMGWVGAAVSALPLALRLAFVRLNADMDADAVALTVGLLRRHTVRNAFFLASHEFKDLSRPWDWALLGALGERLHVMGCDYDTWLSRRQYDEMLGRLPGLQASWHPDLRHAFCVSQQQSDAVAAALAGIAQCIPSLQPSSPWGSRLGSVSAASVGGGGSSATSSGVSSGAEGARTPSSTCSSGDDDDGGEDDQHSDGVVLRHRRRGAVDEQRNAGAVGYGKVRQLDAAAGGPGAAPVAASPIALEARSAGGGVGGGAAVAPRTMARL